MRLLWSMLGRVAVFERLPSASIAVDLAASCPAMPALACLPVCLSVRVSDATGLTLRRLGPHAVHITFPTFPEAKTARRLAVYSERDAFQEGVHVRGVTNSEQNLLECVLFCTLGIIPSACNAQCPWRPAR